MSSFFGRFKGTSASSNPGGASLAPRKDPNTAPQSPLENLLANSGPVRNDGSDKFFGMQNPSNTCYCNSVIQCLYYSEPFREKVVNFPYRPGSSLSSETPDYSITRLSQPQTADSTNTLTSPMQSPKDTPKSPQRFTVSPSISSASPLKADDSNKDSFDYQKKMAVQTGPFFDISYDNSAAYGMQTSLFTGLKDIFEAIVSQRAKFGIIALNRFLQTLREGFETFRTPLHQDAHEFLNLLLNDVVMKVEDYSKAHPNSHGPSSSTQLLPGDISDSMDQVPNGVNPTSTSWVHELFEGTLTSETRCLTCETVSRRDEVFLDLSVDLDEHSSVTSCLRRFSEEEMLRERNKFHCDHCSGLQEAEKRMKIKRLPRILALHLKRFKYTEELGRLQKLFHRVVFPFHLRLFNTTDDTEDPDRLYELYAIIVHLGSTPFHGHYVSIIKTKDHGWLLFDDELVLPVNKNYVRNFFGGDPRNSACAYVLFYQETTAEAMLRDQEMDLANGISPSDEQAAEALLVQRVNGSLPKDADHLGIVTSNPANGLSSFASLGHAISVPLAASGEPGSATAIGSPASLPRLTAARSTEGLSQARLVSVEDSSHGLNANSGVRPARQPSTAVEKQEEVAISKDTEQHVKTGSFSRFRPSNLSIRQRQKRRDSSPPPHPIGPEEIEASTTTPTSAPEKSKLGRFGLGKKKTPFSP